MTIHFARMARFLYGVTAALIWASWPAEVPAAEAMRFEVRLDAGIATAPVDGRLFVMLTKGRRDPRFGPRWFGTEPFFACEVKQFKPGGVRTVDAEADGYPQSLDRLPPGRYRVQALLDHDFYDPHPGTGVGNFYSDVAEVELDPAVSGPVELVLRNTVAEKPFPESKWVKEVVLRSELLSKFHGRAVVERAAVVLPADYEEHPRRRYPTMYVIPGFGGSHRDLARRYQHGPPAVAEGEEPVIRVLLSGQCKWGHHVYADSATNGPRGECLVKELISRIDREFRTVAEPAARFLYGHSSGGWSSLWLQVRYPDEFGGVWSIAPDPVDFRSFSGVDLYADPPLSFFRDAQGGKRPIARSGDRPLLRTEDFCRMDDVLARGGQLRSFEAVFSPRGSDGLPARLWNRRDGRIDPEIARAWRKYDIRLILEQNWPQLGPKLQGKLHIVVGSLDTFYLNEPVELLAASLHKLGSDAEIEFVPGADHGTVLSRELQARVRREVSEAFRRGQTKEPAAKAGSPDRGA